MGAARGAELLVWIVSDVSLAPGEPSNMTSMVSRIAALQDYDRYRDLHWEGSFEDYLSHRARAARRSREMRSSASTT